MQEKRRVFLPTLVIILLVIAVVSNVFILGPLVIVTRADPGDVSDSYYNETQLNVTVLQFHPRVLWFDIEYNNGGTWESRDNAQIDTNGTAQYRFIVNISSDQGWDDIDYIWINAWTDNGTDPGSYNSTLGGNVNLNFSYDNSSGIGAWSMIWPDNEITFNTGSCTETNVTGSDPNHSPGNTETYNVTFVFTPSYQMRYAPDPTNTAAGLNDVWSWNYNITVKDAGGYINYHNPTTGEAVGEFGVFSYTEIVSAGWPVITGNPGDNATSNTIPIETRSNSNYSLSVNVTNLTHTVTPSYNISNTSIAIAGGDLASTQLTGNAPLYIYGSPTTFKYAMMDAISLVTNDVQYRVNISLGQQPGDYEATIFYHLNSETGY